MSTKKYAVMPSGCRVFGEWNFEGSFDLSKLDFSCTPVQPGEKVHGRTMISKIDSHGYGEVAGLKIGQAILSAQEEGRDVIPAELREKDVVLLLTCNTLMTPCLDRCFVYFFWDGKRWARELIGVDNEFDSTCKLIRIGA